MNQPQFIISRVSPVHPLQLALTFADGYETSVNLTQLLNKHPTLRRLADPGVFEKVAPDEWRRGVIFNGDDELMLASDNLRALSYEQAGQYSHQQLIAWMHKHHLSLEKAAEALGLSRRMLAYYKSGRKPLPKTVGLAMKGWEFIHDQAAA
jgi:hypothetical protein